MVLVPAVGETITTHGNASTVAKTLSMSPGAQLHGQETLKGVAPIVARKGNRPERKLGSHCPTHVLTISSGDGMSTAIP
jgi:hypothetical protein